MRGRRVLVVGGRLGSMGAAAAAAISTDAGLRDVAVEIELRPPPKMPEIFCEVREPRRTKVRDWEQRDRQRRRP